MEYSAIKKGRVKNPLRKTLFGVGYYGIGQHKSWDNANKRNFDVYICWKGMMERGYCPKRKITNPSYKEATVCEEWHNFQNFAEWYEANYITGWYLDKDILEDGNKIYCPKLCAFVPREINNTFSFRYKNKLELPPGVSLNNGRYLAAVSNGSKVIHIGSFETVESAFFTYCKSKEVIIRELAEEWKLLLDERVYEAMINFRLYKKYFQ